MQDTTFIWVSYTHKVTFLDPSHSKKLFNYFVLRCHFVSLIQFSPFLLCILGNERMEVMKGAHLLISCTHICHFFPLLYGTVLKARQIQNIVNSKVIAVFFSVHSDFASYYYNLLQQPQKRGRKLEGAKGEPDSI